jgi:histone deacetylase 1/2
MKQPEVFFKELIEVHGYKLKGVGEPNYHLGGNYFRDPDGTLVWGAQKYITRLLENYERTYGEMPPKYCSPMEKEAHPELDESALMGPEDIKKFQSHIGALQWCVTLGRFDIACAVMMLARFRVQPRVGHHKMIGQIYGYLRHTKNAAICFRTNVPDYSHLKEDSYDWSETVYCGIEEEIPEDMPVPKGKPVRITTYVDANLLHCCATGRSCSGILHIINSTIIDWFSKKQATVESATYGSEFMAARQAVQQIMDLRLTLRYMGVPLDGPAWLFGDNMSVIKSGTIPASTLNKRHNALSYHTVRSAVAAGIVKLCHIPGAQNLADCLTKHLEPRILEPLVRPHLHWQGAQVEYGPRSQPEE